MTAYEYFKQEQERIEREKLKWEVLEEVRNMVKVEVEKAKNDILGAINREIDI